MGWKWVDDGDDVDGSGASSGRGFGELVKPNPKSAAAAADEGLSGGGGDEDRCSTRTVVQSRCRTEEVEPGRFVRKCEKTQQILRSCVGRPLEVVESTTEHTEDDVTDEVKRGAVIYDSPPVDPFTLPGFRSDIEAIERTLTGNLGQFMEAAEEMANGFFNIFGNHSWHPRESTPFGRNIPNNERHETNPAEQTDESAYAELARQVREV